MVFPFSMSTLNCVELNPYANNSINEQVLHEWHEVTGEKLQLRENLVFYALVTDDKCIGFGGIRMRGGHLTLTKLHLADDSDEVTTSLLLNHLLEWADKHYDNNPLYVQLRADSPLVELCKSMGFDRPHTDVIGVTELCRGQKL